MFYHNLLCLVGSALTPWRSGGHITTSAERHANPQSQFPSVKLKTTNHMSIVEDCEGAVIRPSLFTIRAVWVGTCDLNEEAVENTHI